MFTLPWGCPLINDPRILYCSKNGQYWPKNHSEGIHCLRMAILGGLFSSLFCSDRSKWDLRWNFHCKWANSLWYLYLGTCVKYSCLTCHICKLVAGLTHVQIFSEFLQQPQCTQPSHHRKQFMINIFYILRTIFEWCQQHCWMNTKINFDKNKSGQCKVEQVLQKTRWPGSISSRH